MSMFVVTNASTMHREHYDTPPYDTRCSENAVLMRELLFVHLGVYSAYCQITECHWWLNKVVVQVSINKRRTDRVNGTNYKVFFLIAIHEEKMRNSIVTRADF